MTNILDYLEMTAKKTSWKTAVDDGRVCMSWRELMDLSRRIGTAFSKRTQPGSPVVILMEKSALTLVAMFGAVYAGCFYTVIDPSQPEGRIMEIVHQLSPEIILVEGKEDIHDDADLYKGKKVLLKDCLHEGIDMDALKKIRRESGEDDLLYCLFTSGSSGKPKGVAVSHRAVIDFITHFTETFGITEVERIGNQAPFDFDVSVKDIYSCVFTGATLVLIPQKLFVSPPHLLDYLCIKRITVLIWAVSALTLISSLKGLSYRVPAYVKKVMFSGEVMPVRQLRLWQTALPKAEFINLYGPTEITCNCTYYRIDRVFAEDEKIPIGKPFAGRKVFLVDENGQVIREKEVSGEICVTGESLSDGYYHAPEETGKRFLKDADGQIYYMTGDLGYQGFDGEFYFCGRKDFQIKIMGRRIEPEEVEYILNQVQGVDRSCCIVDKERKNLMAYYCGPADQKMLRSQIRKRLPSYMIPKKIIRVEKIPLNKNGKTDRTQLLKNRLQTGAGRTPCLCEQSGSPG